MNSCHNCKHHANGARCGCSAAGKCTWTGAVAATPTMWEAKTVSQDIAVGDLVEYIGSAHPTWIGTQILVKGIGANLSGIIIAATPTHRGVENSPWSSHYDPALFKLVVRPSATSTAWTKESTTDPVCTCRGGGYYGHDKGCQMDGFYSSKSTAYFK